RLPDSDGNRVGRVYRGSPMPAARPLARGPPPCWTRCWRGVVGRTCAMQPLDAAADAGERAEAAERRTKEIADRLTRLAGGHRTDRADLLTAQQRADEARERAERSLDRAV